MKKTTKPTFRAESKLWNLNIKHVIGMDEVGRGAFAGPIIAAGVIYKPNSRYAFLKEINDSKKLTSKRREKLSFLVKKHCSYYAIEKVELGFINKWGIGLANQKVFEKVVNSLITKIQSENYYILIDGRRSKNYKQKGIVKGDNKSISIASASIIAKVKRDEIMIRMSKKYPEYKFSKNKGYGTKFHRIAIKKYGLTNKHRIFFKIKY